MLQVTNPSDVSRSGVHDEREFSIKRTSKAFQILSSGLYSNKILAIVRELSCNAWDAHVAAGKNTLPIEIKLPTYVDDTFYVKDFGIGLSHEDVLNIYTTYFESTKTGSNDFIGALGLGSKSPFSYTNNFIVESRFNSVKRVYTAFINESGIPAIALMGEEVTDESNGVTVMFSVKPNDRRAFAEAAAEALVYFNPSPVLKGTADFKVNPITFTVSGTGWNVRNTKNSQYVGNGPRAVQGFVSYPIDMDQLLANAGDTRQLVGSLREIDMDIIVPIGEVEVAASREALSYDQRTIANLRARMAAMAPLLAAELQHNLDACPTVWEASKLFSSYTKSGSNFRDLIFATNEFTYKGGHIDDIVKLELAEPHIEVIVERRKRSYNRKTTTVQETYRFEKAAAVNIAITGNAVTGDTVEVNVDPATTKMVIDDVGHSVQRTVDEWVGNHGHSSVIVFRNVELVKKLPVDVSVVETILAKVGLTLQDPSVVLMSTITSKKPRVKQTYVKKAPNLFKVWTGYKEKATQGRRRYGSHPNINRTFSRLTWKDKMIDMNDPAQTGYYVPIERFAVVKNYGGAEYAGIDLLFGHAEVADIITKGLPLIGVSENDMKKLNHKHWKNLFEVVDKAIAARLKGGLGEELARSQLCTVVDRSHTLKNAWKNMSPLVTPCDVKTFLDTLYHPTTIKVDTWKELLDMVGIPVDNTVKAIVTTQIAAWSELVRKYDVWQCIDWDRCGQREHAAVAAKYLNVCISLT